MAVVSELFSRKRRFLKYRQAGELVQVIAVSESSYILSPSHLLPGKL